MTPSASNVHSGGLPDRANRLVEQDRNPAAVAGHLVGRIIAIETIHDVTPRFDVCRFITRTIWLILLISSPLIVLYATLKVLGALPALLALIGVCFLLKCFSLPHLFSTIGLFRLLNPFPHGTGHNSASVRHLRVRNPETEAEVMAVMRGQLLHGNVMSDDLVSLYGKWRRGILEVTRCYNHRTGSWVEAEQSNSWIGLVATLLVVGLIVLILYEPTTTLCMKLRELRGLP